MPPNIEITHHLDAADSLVYGDSSQISQVIQNIILNAASAMPEGGTVEVSCQNLDAEKSVELDLPKSGNHVCICIKDTGVGISADIIILLLISIS